MGAMLYVIGQRLQVYGNAIGSAANSAVLIALEPITTSLAAAMFLREHIGPRRIAGFLLGMAGVALLNGAGRPDFSWGSLGASLIFASSFICEAAYSVMGKTIVQRFSVMKMLAISILIGTAINLLIDGHSTIAAAKGLSVPLWGLIITMAIVCTAIGYSLWFVVIRDCPVNVAALTIFAQALFGVLIAAVWLHEKLRAAQLWGGLIIVAGMAIGLSRQIKVNGGRADETSKSKLQNS
jgi:drug/metabolite transporter (DMT)-like permease